jgi:hypothetical protein
MSCQTCCAKGLGACPEARQIPDRCSAPVLVVVRRGRTPPCAPHRSAARLTRTESYAVGTPPPPLLLRAAALRNGSGLFVCGGDPTPPLLLRAAALRNGSGLFLVSIRLAHSWPSAADAPATLRLLEGQILHRILTQGAGALRTASSAVDYLGLNRSEIARPTAPRAIQDRLTPVR